VALADQIRRRRQEQALSLAELARRAEVSRAYLHELENGTAESNPSAKVLYRIAFALGSSVGELMEKQLASSGEELTDIPAALHDFALAEHLDDHDVRMLAGIKYKSRRPATIDDWRFLYASIQRSVSPEG
jgi:transcriptional regulator with XRE-family HTH domain